MIILRMRIRIKWNGSFFKQSLIFLDRFIHLQIKSSSVLKTKSKTKISRCKIKIRLQKNNAFGQLVNKFMQTPENAPLSLY